MGDIWEGKPNNDGCEEINDDVIHQLRYNYIPGC